MLMVEVFAPLSKSDGGEALLIEGVVIAAAQEAIEAELQNRLEVSGGEISSADAGNRAGEFPRWPVALQPEAKCALDLLGRGGRGYALREDTNPGLVLESIAGRGVT